MGIDGYFAMLAAKYLNMSFSRFDDSFSISVDILNSYDRLEEQFALVFSLASGDDE
ncbi:MAG: hypothetical protein ACYTKD_30360 [Planctomycetota bacterium]